MAAGRRHRLTAAEIERVRNVYRNWTTARRERRQVMAELNVKSDAFCRIGSGLVGKKPRVA